MTDAQMIEIFEERAAIAEYDGKLPRHEAEIAAYRDLRKQLGQGVAVPVAIQETVKRARAAVK